MSDQEYISPARRLPLEVLYRVIHQTIYGCPVKDALALRRINRTFAYEVDKILYRDIETRPSTWNSLPHHFRTKYLDQKLRETKEDCYLTKFMKQLQAFKTTEEEGVLKNRLIEAMALGYYDLEDMILPKRLKVLNEWGRCWTSEPIESCFRVLLACSAMHRGDIPELRRIVSDCTRVLTMRFGLSVMEEAARTGTKEIVTLLLPFTRVNELSGEFGPQGWTAPLGSYIYQISTPNIRINQPLVPLALKYKNKDAVSVWRDYVLGLPASILQNTVGNVIQAAKTRDKTDLQDWLIKELSDALIKKHLDHFTFNNAMEFGDIRTIDLFLSREGFDPAFTPADSPDNPLLVAMRCTRWFKLSLIKALLDRGVLLNKGRKRVALPLKTALMDRDLQIISLLLNYGASIHPNDFEVAKRGRIRTSRTLLAAAVVAGDNDLVSMLLRKGMNMLLSRSQLRFRVELVEGEKIPLLNLLWETVPMQPEGGQTGQEYGQMPPIVVRWRHFLAEITGVNSATFIEEVRDARVSYRLIPIHQ